MNVTDDRQTDGRVIAYSEREREFTFAKNSPTSTHARVKVDKNATKRYPSFYKFWSTTLPVILYYCILYLA